MLGAVTAEISRNDDSRRRQAVKKQYRQPRDPSSAGLVFFNEVNHRNRDRETQKDEKRLVYEVPRDKDQARRDGDKQCRQQRRRVSQVTPEIKDKNNGQQAEGRHRDAHRYRVEAKKLSERQSQVKEC